MKRSIIILPSILILFACATIHGSEKIKFATDEKLGDVYAMAITDGYEYMFDRSGDFTINGKRASMFEGGFQGLFLYSDLKEALTEHHGIVEERNERSGYYNLSIFHQWAGMDLFATGEKSYHGYRNNDTEQLFHYYNPEVVNWAADNMIPKPSDMIGDRTAQEVYDHVMQRFFRLMTETYRFLQQNDPDKMVEEYMSEVNKDYEPYSYGAMNYLTDRYDPQFPEYGTSDGTRFTAGMALGFWMRRSLDGTMDEFWNALEKTMNVYDSKWFNT